MNLNATLSWFQTKIGTYDKQSWERSVEKSILKGFRNIPKKSAKVKTDFIDVDLVRGSTFPKAKPQHGVLAIVRKAVFRTFLLPFFWTWWVQQTTRKFAFLLLALYVLQSSALIVYATQFTSKEQEEASLSEVLSPLVITVVLGTIYSQVVSTTKPLSISISSFGRLKRKRIKRRRSSKTFAKSSMTCRSTQAASEAAFRLSCHAPQTADDDVKISSSRYDVAKNSKSFPDSQSSTDSGLFLRSANTIGSGGDDAAKPEAVQIGSILVEDQQTSDEATRHDSAVQDVSSVELETDPVPSDTEVEIVDRARRTASKQNGIPNLEINQFLLKRRVPHPLYCSIGASHRHNSNSSGESEVDTTSSNTPIKDCPSVADMEWGMTTDGTDGEHSYESDSESEETDFSSQVHDDPFCWEYPGVSSSSIFNPSCTASDKGARSVQVSCTIWEGVECKKADLCALDITSAIVRKVTLMPESTDYFVCGVCSAIAMALMPVVFRTQETARDLLSDVTHTVDVLADLFMPGMHEMDRVGDMLVGTFAGGNLAYAYVSFVTVIERFFLSLFFFFLLSVAERTFKQRFLYAKLFSHITSSRRSRRSELPHFRLNKVRNIKTWLSVRSYLKKHGPQRSVDVIVSASFVIALLLISILCVQILKESEHFCEYLYNWEILGWSLALGVYLLRFMTLGAKINKKYRNLSVLLTEQINLYVQMEQKPQKKEGLILANNVLKLASQLLKELESPFKISGFSANPYLYNITKLVILSAFSAVLTELLGFKLKLYKIKIK